MTFLASIVTNSILLSLALATFAFVTFAFALNWRRRANLRNVAIAATTVTLGSFTVAFDLVNPRINLVRVCSFVLEVRPRQVVALCYTPDECLSGTCASLTRIFL